MSNNDWPIVEVEPARLRSGLWGYAEGDIYQSYSADCFAEKRGLRKPFQDNLQWYVAMNTGNNNLHRSEARAYPIRSADQREDILKALAQAGQHDGYAGQTFIYRAQSSVFGLPVIFRRRPLSHHEATDLSRRMFAYGGLFASSAGTYQRFLGNSLENSMEPAIREALLMEIENHDLPQTQEAMRKLIEAAAEQPTRQLTLF